MTDAIPQKVLDEINDPAVKEELLKGMIRDKIGSIGHGKWARWIIFMNGGGCQVIPDDGDWTVKIESNGVGVRRYNQYGDVGSWEFYPHHRIDHIVYRQKERLADGNSGS